MIRKTRFIYHFIVVFLLTAAPDITCGQNFIGLNSSEIAALMKTSNPQFKIDKSTVNHTFKYLKYVDKITEQTILFFMSDHDECTYVRWVSDYSNLNDMIEMLNRNYKKTGVNAWTFMDKGESYSVSLVEDEWYFTVSYRKN
jgi:hypothetical protein